MLHSLTMPQYPTLRWKECCQVWCVCCHLALTWRSGVSARDMVVGGHWDILAKSSSTSSWCRVSWELPNSCRAITMALVLSARNMRWRQRSRAWLTSCRALDTPHGACSMESCYYTDLVWGEVDITLLDYYWSAIQPVLLKFAYLTFSLQQSTIQTGGNRSHLSILIQNDHWWRVTCPLQKQFFADLALHSPLPRRCSDTWR